MMKINNFDLSILVPYNGSDWELVRRYLNAHLPQFQQNGIDILLIVTDDRLAAKAKQYFISNYFYNWKLIYFAPQKFFELVRSSLKFCRRKELLLLSVDNYLNPLFIETNILLSRHHPNSVIVAYPESTDTDMNFHPYTDSPVVILIKKCLLYNKHLYQLYDGRIKEFVTVDFLRALQYNGVNVLVVKNAFRIKGDLGKENLSSTKTNAKREAVLYDYADKSCLKSNALQYITKFEKSELQDEKIFLKSYGIITCVSIYNEHKHLPVFLENVARHCDGIIILDDGSDDNSFDYADHPKIILKVRKLRQEFRDLDNRNTLLKLAFFLDAKWIMFMDADERIDDRFDSVYELTKDPRYDVHSFNFVNIWDSTISFRTDIDPAVFDNNKGIFRRERLFRNIGYSQIYLHYKRQLHFSSVPYAENKNDSKILVHHLGTLSANERLDKYNFYQENDHNIVYRKTKYKYLLDSKVKVKDVALIKKEDL